MSHHEPGRNLYRKHLFTCWLYQSSLLGLVIYKLLRISQLMQRGDDIWVDSHYLSKGHTEELAWQQPFLYNNITVTGNACCFPALNF